MSLVKSRFPKIFPGWWIVFSSGIISLWTYGFQHYGFSALFKPIATELGFSRTVTSVAASITRFEGGFEAPLAGWVTDRFGARWIVLLGIFLAGVGLILMYLVNSLWAFYAIWGVMVGTGANLALSLPYDTAIANWFVKKRGLASSIKWLLSGLSGVVILPFVAWLITTQGWRMTLVIGGAVLLLVGLPLVWVCLKSRRPEYYGLLPDGATAGDKADVGDQMVEKGVKYAADFEEIEFTLRQAVRTPTFWLLIIANTAHGMTAPAISIHAIPFLTDIGIPPLRAASMLSMLLLVGMPFRLVSGFLVDRVKKQHIRFILAVAYSFQAGGFIIFLLNQTVPMIYVWFIVYGIGQGLTYGPMVPIWGRYFGRKALGSIRGLSSMLMTPVGVAAPIYFGWVYDLTGNYITAFTVTAVLLTISILLICLTIPPKPPAEVTDVRKLL